MADLRTDYKDDVLNINTNERRKYRVINNADGTISFEDVTDYVQNGDNFGSFDINITNKTVNELIAMGLNVRWNSESDSFEVLKNGEWLEIGYAGLLKRYLYNLGDSFSDITGGYEALGISNSSSHAGLEKAPVLTMESTHMNIKWAGTYQYTMGGVLNKKAIDLTDAKKMYVTYNASHNGTIKTAIRFIIGTKNTTPLNNLSETIILGDSTSNISDTIEIDVSSISGAVYYGVLFMTSDGGNINEEVNISSIWTE
jgi:hypothetical protein